MENNLTEQKKNLISLVTDQGFGEVLKPLTQEIHLFDSFIAGTTHLEDPSVLDGLEEGTKLILRREQNKYDDNAILVLNQAQQKLGYIPEKDNIIFARLLDAGKMLGARVRSIQVHGNYRQIAIGIFLIDF